VEIELDLRNEKKHWWWGLVVIATIFVLVGLGAIGSRTTPATADGSPGLLSWQDWRFMQAERAYYAELDILRMDIEQLAAMLEAQPSPVAAQILAERIARHTKSGDASLAAARETLLSAALDVRDWAAGALARDAAIQSVQQAYELINQ